MAPRPALGAGRRRWYHRARRGQEGFTTLASMLAVGLTLVVFVWIANLALMLYGRGVVRAALDEAARAGSRVGDDSVQLCLARAEEALDEVLGGSMGDDVTLSCSEGTGVVQANADVVFRSWMPPVPDWSFSVASTSVKETAP